MSIDPSSDNLAIIGCGLVGRGWALLFARAGFRVRMFDTSAQARFGALEEVRTNLSGLQQLGLVADVPPILARIALCNTLEDAVVDAAYVQEAVFESVAAKRAVFTRLTGAARADAILASSCSTLRPDDFLCDLPLCERCIVAHPFNPPHVIPLVEIVGSSRTNAVTKEQTRRLMLQLGQIPVLVRKPVAGYVVNRLQAAVIAEALHLVDEDVISPEDLDACMKHGLGRRWAFMGPFETMDLNSVGGLKEYVTKYYESAYRRICMDIDVSRPWGAAAVERAERWRRKECPDEAAIRKGRAWRDEMLARLGVFLNQVGCCARSSEEP